MADIDRLEIEVEAQASKANKQLDNLINKLERVSSALTGVNASGLTGFANGISKIAGASAQLGNVKTADFTRLAKNLEKISNVDQASLNRTSASLNAMSQSLGKIRGASQSAIQISELAKNISKLGNKSVQNAMENMPKLASGLNEMMNTLSKAPTVSNNLIQMTNALANLASQGSKVGTAINSMGTTGSKGTSLLSGWLGRLTSSTVGATKATRSFSQIAGSFYANFYLLIRGLRKAWSATESSMDFLETVNYFEVAMRKLGDDAAVNWEQAGYDSAEAYAKSFSERAKQLTTKMTGYEVDEDGNATYAGVKNLGMNPESVMNYQAMFAQVSESIGVAEESALNFSDALTMLGADWASLRNTTFEEAWGKFASALAGQSRAVRAFGIDITNATLQEYAYKYGLTQAISEMNQATKAQLRLLAILDQSKVAFGDLANTMQSPSNQLRMLKQNFSNLARTIGNLFLPIVSAVLPYINGLVMALQRLFSWIGGLLGIKFNSINSSIGGMDSGIEDLVGGTEDAESALGGANDAAKKLKNTVLGFDELNQLNDNSDSSGGSGSGGGIGGGSALLDEEIANALAEYQKAWDEAFDRMENKAQDIADRICNAFKRGDYEGIGKYIGNGITKGLESINWNSVYGVSKNFGKGFAEFLNGLISPSLFSAVGKTIAGALNTAIYNALSFGETFDFKNLGNSIAAGINSFFRTYDFKALAQTINVWSKGILDAIITALDNTDWEMIGKQIGTFFAELDFMEVGAKIGKAIWKAINAGIDVFKGMFDAAPIETTILSLTAISSLLKATITTKVLSGVKKLATNFKLVATALAGNKESVSTLLTQYPKLGKAIDVARKAFANFRFGIENGNVLTGLNEGITTIRNNLTGLQKGVLGTVAVFGEFSLVKSGFKDIASGADNLVASIGKIAVGAGAASVALYTAFGPAGVAVAAITGIAGAVIGINDAIDELRLNSMFEAIKTNGVTSLESLGNVATEAFNKITSGADVTREKLDSISQTRESISGTVSNIDSLKAAIDNGAYTATEKVPEIIEQFQSLLEQSKGIFDEEYDVIVGNVVGAYADILTAQGESVPEFVANLAKLRDEGNAAYSDLETSLYSLIAGYNDGTLSADEFYEKSMPLFEQLEEFNSDGSVDDATAAIQNFGGALDMSKYIEGNTLKVEELQADIGAVVQAAEDGKNNLQTFATESNKAAEEWVAKLETLGIKADDVDWAKYYGASDEQVSQGVSDINAAYEDYADQIQYCLMQELPSVIERATEDYDNMSTWEKMFAPPKGDYVQSAIDDWESNIVTPFSDSLKSSFEQLGIDAEPWIENSVEDMFDSVFDKTTQYLDMGVESTTTTLKDNWKSSLEGALDEVAEDIDAESYGKDLVTEYSSGISKNTSKVSQVIMPWKEEVTKALNETSSAFGLLSSDIGNATETSQGNISNFEVSSKNSFGSINNAIGTTKDSFGILEDKTNSLNGLPKSNISNFVQSANSDFNSAQISANSLKGALDDTTGSAKDLYNQSGKTFNINTDQNSFSTLRSAISGVFDAVNNLFSFNGRTLTINSGVGVSGIGSVGVRGYATGGYPNTGELFMARENGITEMVGSIGNRSAVANNDQIVEGIQSGVEAAMMNVMMAFAGNMGSGNSEAPIIENVIKCDSETLYRSVQKGKDKHDRRYHVVTEI